MLYTVDGGEKKYCKLELSPAAPRRGGKTKFRESLKLQRSPTSPIRILQHRSREHLAARTASKEGLVWLLVHPQIRSGRRMDWTRSDKSGDHKVTFRADYDGDSPPRMVDAGLTLGWVVIIQMHTRRHIKEIKSR